jgi:translocator protein
VSLIPFLLLVALTAFLGGLYRPDSWYMALSKPSWTPPGWIFPPVWSALYICIAIAGWRAWLAAPSIRSRAIGLWVFQLVLNSLWTWLFFGRHHIGLALADILLLLVAVLTFIGVAWKTSRTAAWLFIPYALWIAFASSLTFSIWLRN